MVRRRARAELDRARWLDDELGVGYGPVDLEPDELDRAGPVDNRLGRAADRNRSGPVDDRSLYVSVERR